MGAAAPGRALAARAADILRRARGRRPGRALLLTLAGVAYGLAGHLALSRGGAASLPLVYALDVVPVAVGYRVSPRAGAWVGAVGSLSTGVAMFSTSLGDEALGPYLLAVVAAAVAAGALLGWLPARAAPGLEARRLYPAMLACAAAVGLADVAPVLAGRLIGRSYVVNLWVWPAMTALSFAAYALVVAPLARAAVRRGRSDLVRAAVALGACLVVTTATYDAVPSIGPERFEPFIEPGDPGVAALAARLAPAGLAEAERVNATFRFVRDEIAYLADPPVVGDYIQPPAETLSRGYGDCEDKAILLVSLLRAEGFDAEVEVLPGHARVRLDWNGTTVALEPSGGDDFPGAG